MPKQQLLSLLGFVTFVLLVAAAPPTSRLVPATIPSSLFNITTPRAPEFPHPLPDPFTYHVQYTSYNIIFFRTSVLWDVNATQIHTCITKAVRMASAMSYLHADDRLHGRIVTYGGASPFDVLFSVETLGLRRGDERALSWQGWANVLVGFVRFTQAYEGVGFEFEIESDDSVREKVAIGYLY
ncbi:FAD-dependent monooxygenase [Physcia stellaris]|nr:FAD-dependent monooxygenase [Physcia stellaris]